MMSTAEEVAQTATRHAAVDVVFTAVTAGAQPAALPIGHSAVNATVDAAWAAVAARITNDTDQATNDMDWVVRNWATRDAAIRVVRRAGYASWHRP